MAGRLTIEYFHSFSAIAQRLKSWWIVLRVSIFEYQSSSKCWWYAYVFLWTITISYPYFSHHVYNHSDKGCVTVQISHPGSYRRRNKIRSALLPNSINSWLNELGRLPVYLQSGCYHFLQKSATAAKYKCAGVQIGATTSCLLTKPRLSQVGLLLPKDASIQGINHIPSWQRVRYILSHP